jgi:intracellular septation protein A
MALQKGFFSFLVPLYWYLLVRVDSQLWVNFNKTKVIKVTEIARTVRNPVFIPKIRKKSDVISVVFPV